MTVLALQRRLTSLGFDPGPHDGWVGPLTLDAMNAALDRIAPAKAPPVGASAAPALRSVLPADWLAWAQMQRVIVHWTAGGHKASATDKKHYHILIEGDGAIVRGTPSIALNQAPVKAGYAAHTLNCNSGSIGVSLCCMAGAVERPFSAGKSPLTREQWAALPAVLAELCRRYSIPVTPGTVLTHAEVQATLGIAQRGKWDIAILPFEPAINTAKAVGDRMRSAVAALL